MHSFSRMKKTVTCCAKAQDGGVDRARDTMTARIAAIGLPCLIAEFGFVSIRPHLSLNKKTQYLYKSDA